MKIDLSVAEFKELITMEDLFAEVENWTPLLDENMEVVEGYEVSDIGRVRKNGVVKKLTKNGEYLSTRINGKLKYVHRLVLQSFHPTPDKTLVADHIDENGLKNVLSNLQWLTNAQNVKKSYKPKESSQKVRGINLETGEIKQFDSLSEAGRYVRRHTKTVADALKYGYKVAGSWIFDKEVK